MKKLVYKIAVTVDPATADVARMLEALKPFGTAEIVGTSMKQVD